MDIRHYFDAVHFSDFFEPGSIQWKYSLGKEIEKTTLALSPENIYQLDVAIIGIPFDSSNDHNLTETIDSIRKEIYLLAKPNNLANVADFGNIKTAGSLKANLQALRDITEYFNELKIVTVVIGGSQDLTIGICEAYKTDAYFSLTCIDAFLDIKKGKESLNSSNYLSYIFKNQPHLFQFNLVGFQSHFVANEYLSKITAINQHVRLGLVRENILLTEPVFRNSDVISFDLGAVIHSEAPGSRNFLPNGLRSEEACQLAKYAGINNRVKVFGLFEIQPENDINNITLKLSAQIIWYFLEGISNRIQELPGINKDFIVYQVEVKNVDKPLVFLKNTISNRWWLEVPLMYGEPKYFACSEKEYNLASNNEIPGLWLKYIQKLDELLK